MLKKVFLGGAVVAASVFSVGVSAGAIEIGTVIDNFDDVINEEDVFVGEIRVTSNDRTSKSIGESKELIEGRETETRDGGVVKRRDGAGKILGIERKRTISNEGGSGAGNVTSQIKEASNGASSEGVLSFNTDDDVRGASLEVLWTMDGTEDLTEDGFDALVFELFNVDLEKAVVTFSLSVNDSEEVGVNVKGKGEFAVFKFSEFAGVDFGNVSNIRLVVTSEAGGIDLSIDSLGTCKINPSTGECGTVPEPSSLALFGLGGILLGLRSRRRAQSRKNWGQAQN